MLSELDYNFQTYMWPASLQVGGILNMSPDSSLTIHVLQKVKSPADQMKKVILCEEKAPQIGGWLEGRNGEWI